MRKSIRFVLLAVAALLIVSTAKVQPAQAVVKAGFSDDFENNAQARWTCEVYFSNSGCVVFNIGGTHSGQFVGAIWVHGATSNWTGIGRTVTLTPPAGTTTATSCQAKIWVANSSQHNSGGLITGKGQLEIINPSSWTYITTAPFTFTATNTAWNFIYTSFFTPPSGSIYLRVVDYGNGISTDETYFSVDDMSVSCAFS